MEKNVLVEFIWGYFCWRVFFFIRGVRGLFLECVFVWVVDRYVLLVVGGKFVREC